MADSTPDLRPYVDLTLYDRDPEDVFETFITDVRSRIPGYEPVETNTEMVIAQSLALEVAEEIFALNRLPSATIEGVLRLFGVLRDEGAAPTTTLAFTLGDTAGHSIPAGTRAALVLADGLEPVVFVTTAELVVPAGASTGTVAAQGNRLTADVNGYPAGTLLELLDSVSFAEGVTLGSQPVNGRDAESQETWLSRGTARFSRLSETLTLPRHFADFALEHGAFRAVAIDNYDPATGADQPGHVTVAVYGKGDLPVPIATKTAIAEAFVPVSAPNLLSHVTDPTVTAVNVTATVARRSGYNDVVVAAAAEQSLRTYLSPDSWNWSKVVRRTQLISLLATVEGVAYVTALTSPTADLTLPGVATLTRPGSISVVVVPEGST